MARKMRISYFGHDSSDAAIRKRIRVFQSYEYEIEGFMNRRLDGPDPEWNNIELGKTENGAYFNRVLSVFRGAFGAAKHKQKLDASDLIFARNLDMLATAFLALRLTGLKKPVVYECLDVHRLLCRQDFIGWMARKLEGSLLKRSLGVIVSSPAFVTEHFEQYYKGQYRPYLVENRLSAAFADAVPRPANSSNLRPESMRPLRLGWIGILRCQRTLDLMMRTAQELGTDIEIRIHGKPDLWNVPNFHETVEGADNVTFYGAYKSPEDLPEIYGGLDLIWSGDFMEAGLNSKWLLPNRIYEGGYFGIPAIAPKGTQTAAWVEKSEAGFIVDEPIEESLIEILRDLAERRAAIETRRATLLDMPKIALVEPDTFMRDTLDQILARIEVPIATPVAKGYPENVCSKANPND